MSTTAHAHDCGEPETRHWRVIADQSGMPPLPPAPVDKTGDVIEVRTESEGLVILADHIQTRRANYHLRMSPCKIIQLIAECSCYLRKRSICHKYWIHNFSWLWTKITTRETRFQKPRSLLGHPSFKSAQCSLFNYLLWDILLTELLRSCKRFSFCTIGNRCDPTEGYKCNKWLNGHLFCHLSCWCLLPPVIKLYMDVHIISLVNVPSTET